MRILYILPSYGEYEGVGNVVKSLATIFYRQGHSVTILHGKQDIRAPVGSVVRGISFIQWPVWAPHQAYYIPKEVPMLRALLETQARKADVVHAHNIHSIFSVYSAGRIKSTGSGTRVILTGHYHDQSEKWSRRRLWLLWRPYVYGVLKKVDAIHAVSGFEAIKLTRDFPKIKNNISVIPNGVEGDALNFRWHGQRSDYALYSGRITQGKNLEHSIDLVLERGLRFVIVGSGAYLKRILAYSNAKPPGRIVFKSFQPRANYLELLSNARYAINMSRLEAFSLFVAEALTMGVPALVSKEIAAIYGHPNEDEPVHLNQEKVFTWDSLSQQYAELYTRNGKLSNELSWSKNYRP